MWPCHIVFRSIHTEEIRKFWWTLIFYTYTRYMPGICQVYTSLWYIPSIYLVYTRLKSRSYIHTRLKPRSRCYGPTGHAIGGTAQQALWSLPTCYLRRASTLSVTTTGRQRPAGGPRRRRRSLRDSHESAVGRRSSWRTRTGETPCYGTDD